MMENRDKKDGGLGVVYSQQLYFPKTDDDGLEKHSSPTMRLIKHKNTTFEHKKVMAENIERGDYSLTYCPSPGKSYVIEPHGGELKYGLVQKNPEKFYDQVINQDITKHSVRPNKQMVQERNESPAHRRSKKKIPLEIKSKITKRPLFKIFNKVVIKLVEKMKTEIGPEYAEDILKAVEDPKIEYQIKDLMKGGKISLVNDQNIEQYKE